MSIFANLNLLAKDLLSQVIRPGDTVVDATLGNGHDALFLARAVGPKGKLIGFDIQKKAIEESTRRLKEEGMDNFSFYEEGHENLGKHINQARAVVFNFGYLPGSSKEIITKKESSLQAVKEALAILSSPGIISLMFYTGHEGGQEEMESLHSYISQLDKSEFDLIEVKHINRSSKAPFLTIIYKKGEE